MEIKSGNAPGSPVRTWTRVQRTGQAATEYKYGAPGVGCLHSNLFSLDTEAVQEGTENKGRLVIGTMDEITHAFSCLGFLRFFSCKKEKAHLKALKSVLFSNLGPFCPSPEPPPLGTLCRGDEVGSRAPVQQGGQLGQLQ